MFFFLLSCVDVIDFSNPEENALLLSFSIIPIVNCVRGCVFEKTTLDVIIPLINIVCDFMQYDFCHILSLSLCEFSFFFMNFLCVTLPIFLFSIDLFNPIYLL